MPRSPAAPQQTHRHEVVEGEHGGRTGLDHRVEGSGPRIEIDAAAEFDDRRVGMRRARVLDCGEPRGVGGAAGDPLR